MSPSQSLVNDILGPNEAAPPSASSALPANGFSVGAASRNRPVDLDNETDKSKVEGFESPSSPNLSALHNPRPPLWEVGHENFRHRQIAYLKAAGLSHRRISARTGYCVITIGNLCRQPWFQQIVNEILEETGAPIIKSLFEGAVQDSFWKLIEVRDDPNTPKNVVEKVANSLIDRVMGKPTQHVEVAQAPSLQDVAVYDRQIAELEEQLSSVKQTSSN